MATKTTAKKTAPKKTEVKSKVKTVKKAAVKPAAVKTAAKPAAAKPAAKKTAPKTAGTVMKKGAKYTCSLCGLVVAVDKVCGCVDVCDLYCCDKPMKIKK